MKRLMEAHKQFVDLLLRSKNNVPHPARKTSPLEVHVHEYPDERVLRPAKCPRQSQQTMFHIPHASEALISHRQLPDLILPPDFFGSNMSSAEGTSSLNFASVAPLTCGLGLDYTEDPNEVDKDPIHQHTDS